MNCIEIKNLNFSYENKIVFEDFSVSFPVGEITVIMSPSGSGKTTLLYLVGGLLRAQSGSILYHVDDPMFSAVFQDCRLIESVSVDKNIRLVNARLTSEDIAGCLNAMGMKDFQGKKVRDLSGGEKQRVAIARALMADYDILLLDEPFTGLDNDIKVTVIEYIKKKTEGKTVLMVTHDSREAELLGCKKISPDIFRR